MVFPSADGLGSFICQYEGRTTLLVWFYFFSDYDLKRPDKVLLSRVLGLTNVDLLLVIPTNRYMQVLQPIPCLR